MKTILNVAAVAAALAFVGGGGAIAASSLQAAGAALRGIGAATGALAVDEYNAAVEANNRGGQLLSEGDYVGAKAAFEQALSHDDDDGIRQNIRSAERMIDWQAANAANDRGNALVNSGDLKGAKAAYEEGLRHLDDPGIRQNLQSVDRVIESQAINAANERGRALLASGDLDGAKAAFEEALTHGDDPHVRQNLQIAEAKIALRDAAAKQQAANASAVSELDQLSGGK